MRSLRTCLSAVFGLCALSLVACGDDTGSGGSGGSGTGGNTGGGGSAAGVPLKVANWNVRNLLNDVVDSPGVMNEMTVPTGEYQAKLAALAKVLNDLDADVVVLSEVENNAVLDDLNDALGGKYSERSLIDSPDPRGVDVAALSKISFSNVVSHQADMFVVQGTAAPEYQFARDAVEYHFTFEGKPVVLVGVHYRSKGPPDDPNKRLAEAQRSRAIANQLLMENAERGVVILGDFNDLPGSAPFNAVAGSGSSQFVDAATFVSEADRWTFDFMGTRELIDHQMASPSMAARLDSNNVVIPHTSDIGAASDHAPMMATYRF